MWNEGLKFDQRLLKIVQRAEFSSPNLVTLRVVHTRCRKNFIVSKAPNPGHKSDIKFLMTLWEERDAISVTRLGDFLHFRQPFKAAWQQLFYPNYAHCWKNFVTVSKSFILDAMFWMLRCVNSFENKIPMQDNLLPINEPADFLKVQIWECKIVKLLYHKTW